MFSQLMLDLGNEEFKGYIYIYIKKTTTLKASSPKKAAFSLKLQALLSSLFSGTRGAVPERCQSTVVTRSSGLSVGHAPGPFCLAELSGLAEALAPHSLCP